MVNKTDGSNNVYRPSQNQTAPTTLPSASQNGCVHNLLNQRVEASFNEFLDAMKNNPGLGHDKKRCALYLEKIQNNINDLIESHTQSEGSSDEEQPSLPPIKFK